jgi:hypothetical protein
MANQRRTGNILGAIRAEADTAMLSRAFVETADYRALVETRDFNFVVGRRGTGKSALWHRVTEHFKEHSKCFLVSTHPQEFEALSLQQAFSPYANTYGEMRALARLAWKVHILMLFIPQILAHYKAEKLDEFVYLRTYAVQHKGLLSRPETVRCAEIIRAAATEQTKSSELLQRIASFFDIGALEKAVQSALNELHRSCVILYDGLDEGWSPDAPSTAVLGGLAAAVSDFTDHATGIHGVLFIRDNMFRALAHLDADFSRHVEGSTLRLHWDQDALLQLVGHRLRVVLQLESMENQIRIWNRFVDHSLQNREGFYKCLQLTLYRPRDILVLLNRAYMVAQRQGREHVSVEDVDATGTSISHDRLQDLVKEYNAVLPGLRYFISVFHGRPAVEKISHVVQMLEEAAGNQSFEDEGQSDFAVFGSGKHILHALFGVGFVGFEDRNKEEIYTFSHDGSGSRLETLGQESSCMVHPSYWRALEIEPNVSAEAISIQVNDEYQPLSSPETKDLRTQRLGQIISELPQLSLGADDSAQFEEWVFTAIKILFSGKLSNPEMKPNRDAIQRRDIVATNMATDGFWRRILEDYGSRQVIFEVKNYEALKPEDYRQVLSYTTGEYGKFAIIVNRSETESLNDNEQGWVRELYHNHGRLVMTLPATIIARCLSKLRNADRFDYSENTLSKRADTFIRSYLSLRQERTFHSPSRKKGKRGR